MTQQNKRSILLMALGTTPHLTTVTLAAIYKTIPNEMPTEIHVVTTKMGAIRARDAYLSQEHNLLSQFYTDYGLPQAKFCEEHIHVIPDEVGEPLADIRTQNDSSRAADYIVNLVREFCSDENVSLHVSIVGGRKSMGMLLGSAMMFYGRDQDRISHVLSSEEQEKSGEPYPSLALLMTEPNRISLGEIPFLRLRPILPVALLNTQHTYSEIIQASQQRLTDRPFVEISQNKTKWQLICEGITVQPETRCMGLYAWLALRKKIGRKTETTYSTVPMERFFFLRLQYVKVLELIQPAKSWENACEQYLGLEPDRIRKIERRLRNEPFEDYKKYYKAFINLLTEKERHDMSVAAKHFSSRLSNPRTKANEKIRDVLSQQIPDVTQRRLTNYQIASTEENEACFYELILDADCIRLPERFLHLLKEVNGKPFEEWKRV